MGDATCRVVVMDVSGDAETVQSAVGVLMGLLDQQRSATEPVVISVEGESEPKASARKSKAKLAPAPESPTDGDVVSPMRDDALPLPTFAETDSGTVKKRLATYLLTVGESKIATAAEATGCNPKAIYNLLSRNDACFARPGFGRIALTEAGKRYARG